MQNVGDSHQPERKVINHVVDGCGVAPEEVATMMERNDIYNTVSFNEYNPRMLFVDISPDKYTRARYLLYGGSSSQGSYEVTLTLCDSVP